jgi:hypothetical protein
MHRGYMGDFRVEIKCVAEREGRDKIPDSKVAEWSLQA